MNTDIEKEFEGCSLVAYADPKWHSIPRTGSNDKWWGTPWTIAFGHTAGVKEGDTCDQDQADQWLIDDLHDALASVQDNVTVPLSDEELSALVDFTFNVGGRNFASSTLLKLLNAGDYAGAEQQFIRWNKAGSQVLAGLTRRRAAEAEMFDQGIA